MDEGGEGNEEEVSRDDEEEGQKYRRDTDRDCKTAGYQDKQAVVGDGLKYSIVGIVVGMARREG